VPKCPATGKRAFDRRHAAVLAMRCMGGHGSAYRCPHCGRYHVTRQSWRVARAIRLLLSIPD
jgi:predicted RNA-binding Zn-ribbon protein involved in translation (DUF1610 family)